MADKAELWSKRARIPPPALVYGINGLTRFHLNANTADVPGSKSFHTFFSSERLSLTNGTGMGCWDGSSPLKKIAEKNKSVIRKSNIMALLYLFSRFLNIYYSHTN